MTIEIAAAQSAYQYKIDADDPCTLRRRRKVKGARWTVWMTYEAPEAAKRALLQVTRKAEYR